MVQYYGKKVKKENNVEQLGQLFTNELLIVPAVAWLVAQVLKLLITALVNKKLTFERLVGDGGMPSGHSATVTALAFVCGFCDGFGSATFAIAAILAVVVMHDAMGVRRETGKQALSIMAIVDVVNQYVTEKDKDLKTDKLKVMVGHTPLQVVCGFRLGFVIALAYYLIFAL